MAASMQFIAGGDRLLLSNGAGWLGLLVCADWHLVQSWQSPGLLGGGGAFVVVSAAELKGAELLHCLLVALEADGQTAVHWLTLQVGGAGGDGGAATAETVATLRGRGCLEYCCLETPDCAAVWLATEGRYRCSKADADADTPTERAALLFDTPWLQTDTEVLLSIRPRNNSARLEPRLLTVDMSATLLSVVYDGCDVVRGQLKHPIDAERSTHALQPDGLGVELALIKAEKGREWTGLWEESEAAAAAAHERLAHLCSDRVEQAPPTSGGGGQEEEECDAPGEREVLLERIEPQAGVTHWASLGGHAPLLALRAEPHLQPALALRHDVDACLWQPTTDMGALLRHTHTLPAMAYVTASKRQRKFVAASPNLAYWLVCDSAATQGGHLFVYRPSKKVGVEVEGGGASLRNRTTGKLVRHMAVQQVVALAKLGSSGEDEGEVMGVCATPNRIFLLMEQAVYAIKV